MEELQHNFKFGPLNKKRVYLSIKKSHSNLFMTLSDCVGSVIICKTAAMVLGKSERRRRRKSPQIMEYMISSLEKYFTLYDIWCVKIILHIRPGQYITNIIKSLLLRNIFLIAILNRRKLPYSFTRGKKKKDKFFLC